MAYYDALIAKWNTLTGTTTQKLEAINTLTVAGPSQDIAIASIISYLALNNKLVPFEAYANGSSGNAEALQAAKTFFLLAEAKGISVLQTSEGTVHTQLQNMLTAIVADSASGIVAADAAAILAMAETTTPWSQVSGYSTPISGSDISNAGLS